MVQGTSGGAVCFYPDGTRRIRSALLVDFDNVFLGLRDIDEEAAIKFANEPRQWLTWLETQKLPMPDYQQFHRRIVVKRCYLNPNSFWRHRPFFVRSGFQTIDCPPLTLQGKTSADIHIVIDAIELMEQEPRIDEFILLATDADYTPVLRRLARADRHTLVLAVGDASAAYKSACDLLLDQDKFVDVLLGEADDEMEELIPQAKTPLVAEQPTAAERAGEKRTGPIVAPETDGDEASGVIGYLNRVVSNMSKPITLAAAASALIKQFGADVTHSWADRNLRFKDFLEAERSGSRFEISDAGPGFIYDPERHTIPESAVRPAMLETSVSSLPQGNDGFASLDPNLVAFIRRVHEVTNVPQLTPGQYACLFDAIAEEVDANGYHLMGTPKIVRDRCATTEHPVTRNAATSVMRVIAQAGHRFEKGAQSAQSLRNLFKDAIAKLCKDAGWIPDEAETELLNRWMD